MTSPSGPAAVGQDAEGGGAKTPTARTDGHGLGAAGQSPGKAGPGPATARPGLDGPGPTSSRRPATGPAAPRPFDAGPIWARWLPPVLALVLSLWGITTPSYWRDEAATIAAIQRPFGDLITMLGNVDAVHGAYYMLMWPLLHLFGAGEFVLRLPSAIAVAVTAAAVAAIGRRLISPWAGLAAGLVFAMLPVATRYGQEARSYAMVVAMAAIASYLLLRVLGAEPVRRRRWLVAYGASVAALGILNIFGLLLVGAHLVTVVLEYWRRKADPDYRRLAVGWLVAAAAGIVVASPLLVLGWMQKGQIAWLAVNKSSSGPGTLLTLSGSLLVTAAVVAVIAIALVVSAATGKEKTKSG